ncbi:hypothetical protein [Amycolatopsis nigrescens]|nr:hypothetical protein [Amycolatopsis nigrescens]
MSQHSSETPIFDILVAESEVDWPGTFESCSPGETPRPEPAAPV